MAQNHSDAERKNKTINRIPYPAKLSSQTESELREIQTNKPERIHRLQPVYVTTVSSKVDGEMALDGN